MKKILLYALVLASIVPAFAQTTLTLTFNGRDQNSTRVQLDNVVIVNVTRGWTEAIFFPDTVYTITVGTGVEDYLLHGGMQVMPNPFDGRTQVNINSAKTESMTMTLMDINGKRCAEYKGLLSDGNNYFEIELTTPQTYILSVQTADGIRSLKMVNTGSAGRNLIKESGVSGNAVQLKSAKGHTFELGDEMRYTGYSQQSNGLIPSTPITQNQYESEIITLHFTLVNDAELPIVATVAASNIGMNTATTGGNIFSDGGAPVTARGVCYSVTPNPTLSESHTADGTGTGAFTSNLTNLVENTTYYVRAYATNIAGTAYGNEISFTTETGSSMGNACPGAPTVTDYDGNIYNTVQIGTQCWMRENLRTTHYANGDPIAEGTDYSSNIPYRYTPNGNAATVTAYGYLYNWPAVMHGDSSSNTNPSGIQGICPLGWHVPSAAEWDQLATYVNSRSEFLCGGYNNYIAKALASNIGWNYHNVSNTCAVCNDLSLNNATGFSAMPAGVGLDDWGFGNMAAFSSSTADNYGNINLRGLCYDEPEMTEWPCDADGDMDEGLSVRCIRGEGSSGQVPKVVTTSTVTNITSTSATCGGNVVNSGSAPVTTRGVCYSTSPNPTIADSHTNDGSGPGAFTSNLTGLTSGTLYYLRAYATNSLATTYGEEIAFITYNPNDGQPCTGTPILTDYDGNHYNTVQIGNQCWMKENLRTTHYANGDECKTPSGSSFNEQAPWRFTPDDNSSNVTTYGYLYNLPAVMHGSDGSSSIPSGVQGICPTGWHVPSINELSLLCAYTSIHSIYHCNNNSQYIAKSLADSIGWINNEYYYNYDSCSVVCNPSLNNTTGFSARPAGYHSSYANSFGYSAYIWSASMFSSNNNNYSHYLNINNYNTGIESLYWDWGYDYDAYSVRCVRDEYNVNVVPPTVNTDSVVKRTDAVAACFGNVTSGGGATVTDRGVCWSTTPNPTIDSNHLSVSNGMGSFNVLVGGLVTGTTYYIRAYATNSAGTGYGNDITFTATLNSGSPCVGTPTVTDQDGNIYNTVQIGEQCWMKENLRVKHYAQNGNSISQLEEVSNASVYGDRYTWAQTMGYAQNPGSDLNQSGEQGVCPNGWHIPSNAEWTELTNYTGQHYPCNNNSSYTARALASNFGWESSNNSCSVGYLYGTRNATGFSIIPAENPHIDPNFYPYYDSYPGSFFWSASTSNEQNLSSSFGIKNNNPEHYLTPLNKNYPLSVRCLRNTPRKPLVSTLNVQYLSDTSAVLGGMVDFDNYDSITVRGIIWSESPIYIDISGNPYLPLGVEHNVVIDSGGIGPFFSTIGNISPNTQYYFLAYASNSVGTGYGQIKNFTTGCAGVPSVTDYDGNTYSTVQIGEQCWMRENLRTRHYADGVTIYHKSYIYSPTDTTAGLFYPNDSLGCVATYGYLYNWKAAMRDEVGSDNFVNPGRVQGICPNGWHLPSYKELSQMIIYVESQSEYRCNNNSSYVAHAFAAQDGWMHSYTTCDLGYNPTNATGFSALPAGYVYYYSYGSSTSDRTRYQSLGQYARFLSSTVNGDNYTTFQLRYSNKTADISSLSKSSAASVRCVHNEIQMSEITTDEVSEITDSSAICGGNISWDGFSPVTERGVCWSTTPNPTIANTHTSGGSGTGDFTINLTGLSYATNYYVRAYAINSAGTAYGEERTFTTPNSNDGQPCTGAATINDYDGNTYNTLQLGHQCWMKENLKTTKFADGTSIPLGSTNSNSPSRYNPGNNASNVTTHGYLYNWYAVMHGDSCSSTNPSEVQGICPNGWHVPSDLEWTQLTNYVNSQSKYWCANSPDAIAKALCATTGWHSQGSSYYCSAGTNPTQSNATGFSILPSAYFSPSSYYANVGYSAYLSSATCNENSNSILSRYIGYMSVDMSTQNMSKSEGLSVRCLRDQATPTTTTTAATNITATNATLNGSISNPDNIPISLQGFEWKRSTDSEYTAVISISSQTLSYDLTGLIPNTSYTYRTFITYEGGTIYGNEMTFTTTATIVPNVTSTDATDITATTVILHGSISNPDNVPIYSRGFEWKVSTATDYTIINISTTEAVMTHFLTGLTANTHYSYRAFVTTEDSTIYSDDIIFLTLETPIAPTVITSAATNITDTTATLNGSVINNDNVTITMQGFEWKSAYSSTYTQVSVNGTTLSYNLTELTAGTDYTYRAFVTTASGTDYGAEMPFTTGVTVTSIFPCTATNSHPTQTGSTYQGNGFNGANHGLEKLNANGQIISVTDYDGNEYPVVQIGSQCWLAQNMRCTHSPITGTYIVNHTPDQYTYTGKMAKWYNNDSVTYAPKGYGLLYNWNATLDIYNTSYGELSITSSHAVNATFQGDRQGICPKGWHVPTDSEWSDMEFVVNDSNVSSIWDYRGTHAGKLAGGNDWTISSTSGAPGDYTNTNRNSSGFSAVPASNYGISFGTANHFTIFWSSSQLDEMEGFSLVRELSHSNAGVNRYSSDKCPGYSVRCLRDTITQPSPTTTSATNITATSATLNGIVVNPCNVTITAQGFEWKNPNTGIYMQIPATGTTMAYNLTGLTANTNYSYRAFVTTASGTSYGAEMTFTTMDAVSVTSIFPCTVTATHPAQTDSTYQGNGFNGANHGLETVDTNGSIISVTDYDGNEYPVVQIGSQCWLAENMRCTHSPLTGTYIVNNQFSETYDTYSFTAYTYTGKMARWYNNDSTTYAPIGYGLLYNWNAAVDVYNTSYDELSINTDVINSVDTTFSGNRQGICPLGWHVPTDAEWNDMEYVVNGSDVSSSEGWRGTHAGKLAGGHDWTNSNTSGAPGDYTYSDRNSSGFSAVPAGSYSAMFGNGATIFQSSSQYEYYPKYTWARELTYYNAGVNRRFNYAKSSGGSVRCLRD